MVLLSDTGLGALLASLGLASSLFKPVPSLVDGLPAAENFLGHVHGVSKGLAVGLPDVQSAPLFGDLTTSNQEDSANGIASDDTSTTVSSTPTSTSNPPNNATATSTGSMPSETSGLIVQDTSCAVEPYDSPIVIAQTFPPFDEAKANVYRYRQQQGVNLGSWFVHEQWMTPSLFTCASGKMISELDIASGWGSTTSARALLERHWDTFVTANDFAYLASIGINTVRLPIGYWNLGPLYCQQTPFEPVADVYRNSWARVVSAINMAADAGLGVLVDLHGAVGSQNGQPHSGISDSQTNLFTDQKYQDQTIAVLTFLTQQLATVTNVVGIQILNEPQNVPQLTDFYTRALTTLRQVSPEAEKMPFYIHDGFDLQRFSDYISARTDFVVQDHHSYFVFTPQDDSESADAHTHDITGSIAQTLAAASQSQRNNLVVDEWSCALTPNSLSKEHDPESARRRFCEGQMQVYQNSTAGWSFWSYNKENCNNDEGWCFKDAVGKSLPSTFFSYERQTNGSATAAPGPGVMAALLKMQLPDLSDILGHAAQADSMGLDLYGAGAVYTPNPIDSTYSASAPTSDPSTETGSNSLSSSGPSINGAPIAATSSSPPTSPTASFILGKREHRFATVHSRRQAPTSQAAFLGISDVPVLSASQHAITKGYSDGFLTAKIFATYGLSKLGFTGQYVEDSLQSLGTTVIEPGKEDYYREWFRIGLADGEVLVNNISLTVT